MKAINDFDVMDACRVMREKNLKVAKEVGWFAKQFEANGIKEALTKRNVDMDVMIGRLVDIMRGDRAPIAAIDRLVEFMRAAVAADKNMASHIQHMKTPERDRKEAPGPTESPFVRIMKKQGKSA
jgi:hypothetical protein